MAKLIDGKAIAKALRASVTEQATRLSEAGVVPGLAVILVGDDPASEIYVRNKERAASKAGVNAQTIRYDAETAEETLLAKIAELNADTSVDAILVQSPVPGHIDEHKIQEAISPAKDVDGFHPENIGRLYANREGYYPIANTPRGIMTMLAHEGVTLAGKNVVIIGRSILVGRPMFALAQAADATVSLLHRYTPDNLRHELLQQADVVIVATGVAGLVTGSDLKAGATVIDVGINRMADGSLVGDVDFASAEPVAGLITPVPGGVGPMTIATLLQTTVELAALHHGVTLEAGWQTI
ncbi:bifunctional methylenetetrahydrofolate dehydrogenase/methenyltetrahydrofolate cyclohydrolase [Weissella cibaria]|jgi:methylenetetrahydrofolate dehydrogenase (NADP+)/methenyltetrahydrofolate cyclohydrolase|uniref:Bifunctional protein FolD n=1 Tax=Weissella cibaria TaxID=137591 RepID=A0A1X4JI39_9LACO|nr:MULTISPECIES: bifunctional methylenetetrahydrofolate dehydrogenase/methenyltetrahydrofolate cyclohydrolase [Weissella]APS27079.1 Bifunctional protein FolD protein [Weissella cibaria]APU62476.1 Bifunctional protein FolD protein [Weissella cibaria]APU64628.1 Bifunctional protein FolD protein [Weissella cibaria]ASS51993.1 Bifunctional protein FolD protein [Weissella cibaria]AVO67436.1 bifunctional methylenetetrahydrofolate dehydrogenase/methenyltetrahydrofolate cyclohydrolase [Weissella cibari